MYQPNAIKVLSKIICVAKNYLKDAIEMRGAEMPKKLVVFTKPWKLLIYNPPNCISASLKYTE
jgi:2-keto-4-pentenoate hydratase/2-oxohepta-3-ene-1,7-dioic acid hydratase in catechol pathway